MRNFDDSAGQLKATGGGGEALDGGVLENFLLTASELGSCSRASRLKVAQIFRRHVEGFRANQWTDGRYLPPNCHQPLNFVDCRSAGVCQDRLATGHIDCFQSMAG